MVPDYGELRLIDRYVDIGVAFSVKVWYKYYQVLV
jgi:hypothetical protein